MKIIKANDQAIKPRGKEGREVRFFFNEFVGEFDWLMITNSHEAKDRKTKINVGDHTHPNAVEVIIFNKPGQLVINGELFHFDEEDTVFLEPSDVHGASNMDIHDCTCILLGKGEPQKG
jgi:hypothetical protein